jgi:ATP-dependent RNA helicase RhlE
VVLKLIQKLTSSSTTSSASTPATKPASRSTGGFESLGLIEPILRAVKSEGYENPTPIQEQSIASILDGRDMLGCAQTGTGKTAAFALPMLQRLLGPEGIEGLTQEGSRSAPKQTHLVRALILAPTRELALQISDSFKTYGKHLPLKTAVVFGGVGIEPQITTIRRGIDILVATPGRLIDLMERRVVTFQNLEILVLDEADRMLDMGFIHDIKRILKVLPVKRQNLLFSATIPKEVQGLIDSILHNPVTVKVTPVSSTSEQVEQRVYHVGRADKKQLLLHILDTENVTRALVFTRTKHNANKLEQFLSESGVEAAAIHGNKSQSARQRALDGFKAGKIRILVASDIAARGIDVDAISHVINFEMPNEPETYVHRIGRTGRAEARGVAMSFCDYEEQRYVATIERMTRKDIPVVTDHPFTAGANAPVPPRQNGRRGPGGGGQRQGRSTGGPRGRSGGGNSSAPGRQGSSGNRSSRR